MNEIEKSFIISKLKDFEDKRDMYSARDAELVMTDILRPLLKENGLDLRRGGGPGDGGLDFLAEKDNGRIAIQFKHYIKNPVSVARVRNLIGAAISNKLSRAILLTSGTFTKAALDTAKMVDPLSIQLIDLPALRKWVAEIEANYDETEIVRIIRTFTQRLIEAIGKNEDLLKEIEWRDMERIVAEIFDGLGFKVELTPLSKDGGRDVILECIVEGRSSSFIVEIKHWRTGQRVGQRLIKDFVQVIMTEKREGGLFLSTFGYADNVVESLTEVERGAVRLGDRDKLVALTQTYLKRKSGTWQSEHSLPQILFKDTI